MEDLMKFLPLAAIFAIAIWKEAKKRADKKEAEQQGYPSETEFDMESVPMPEAWGKMSTPEEIFQPKPLESSQKSYQSRSSERYSTPSERLPYVQKEQVKVAHQPMNVKSHYVALSNESDRPSTLPPSSESSLAEREEEFTIRSVEEARRAIIWGEILQRKY